MSSTSFNRWVPNESTTWIFQEFKKYDDELEKYLWAFRPTVAYVYNNLGKNDADWSDYAHVHFDYPKNRQRLFKNLKDWSEYYKEFQNWTNLNILLSMLSYFETYLAGILTLSLQSDPGVFFSSPKSIDGILILKKGSFDNIKIDEIITECTKGTWPSRLNCIKSLFPSFPQDIENNISLFEEMREIRNSVGHAFGRDIKISRETIFKQYLPIKRISLTRIIKLKNLIWKTAKAIDSYFLNEHIGMFQVLNVYNNIYPSLDRTDLKSRINALKTTIGKTNVSPISKEMCVEVVNYFESL